MMSQLVIAPLASNLAASDMIALSVVVAGFTMPTSPHLVTNVACTSRHAIGPFMLATRTIETTAEDTVEMRKKAAATAIKDIRKAAALFGPAQKDAADAWLEKTVSGGGFSTEALWTHKVQLFDECKIEDDGSSNCQALDAALVDLQSGLQAVSDSADKTGTKKSLAKNQLNKAKLALRSAATKFGPSQRKLADAWLERALKGENEESLIEESLALFGECELSEEGFKSRNKCERLSKALTALQDALGVEDEPLAKTMTGVVVPTGPAAMTDMQYRKWKAGERV